MKLHNEPVYRCRDCLDQGLIVVFHERTMKALRANPDHSGSVYTCGVRCQCSAGARWQSAGVFFDALRMVPCEYRPTAEDLEALRASTMQAHAGTEWTGAGQTYAGATDEF